MGEREQPWPSEQDYFTLVKIGDDPAFKFYTGSVRLNWQTGERTFIPDPRFPPQPRLSPKDPA